MAKVRLTITSTAVQNVYGIVDILLNNSVLESFVQLSAEPQTFEWNIAKLLDQNILEIDLLNDQAYDQDGDGEYEELMQVQVTDLSYSVDGENFVTVIPVDEETATDENGNVYVVSAAVGAFDVWGKDYQFTFTV